MFLDAKYADHGSQESEKTERPLPFKRLIGSSSGSFPDSENTNF